MTDDRKKHIWNLISKIIATASREKPISNKNIRELLSRIYSVNLSGQAVRDVIHFRRYHTPRYGYIPCSNSRGYWRTRKITEIKKWWLGFGLRTFSQMRVYNSVGKKFGIM